MSSFSVCLLGVNARVGDATQTAFAGGGGNVNLLDCPAGTVVTGFQGRAGVLVDNLQFRCQ